MSEEALESRVGVTVKAYSKNQAGFEVERRDDGHYYITKIPPSNKSIGVGDRILEINGTSFSNFKSAQHANNLFDTFRLEV